MYSDEYARNALAILTAVFVLGVLFGGLVTHLLGYLT